MCAPTHAAIGISDNDAALSDLVEVAVVRCTPDELTDEPQVEKLRPPLGPELTDAVLIAHDAPIILKRLRQAGANIGKPPIDTLAIARVLEPTARSYQLNDLCVQYQIARPSASDALADAQLTRLLFLALRDRWTRLPLEVQAKLFALSQASGLSSPLRAFIVAMPGRANIPLLRRPVEPPRRPPPADDQPREEEQPKQVDLSGKRLTQMTASVFGDATANSASPMEPRQEQRDMADDIARVLNNSGIGLIEAGTGVGKSLAYLVPAAIWAAAKGRRVMVVTHTKNLQGQLLENEVPRLRTMLERQLPEVAPALRATILRGQNNYLCRRNVDRALDAWLDHDDDRENVPELLLAQVIVWANTAAVGDREELQLSESDEPGWGRLSASGASCLSDGCPYVEDDECFLDRAYKRAERSHLIIGNQWLLVASLLVEKSRVPYAPVVIIDEAHFFEDVTTDMLARQLSQRTILGRVNRVASENPRRTKTLHRRAIDLGLGSQMSLVAQTRQTRRSVAALWNQLEQLQAERQSERSDDTTLRLTDVVRESAAWQEVLKRWQISKKRIEELAQELDELRETAREQAEDADGEQPADLFKLAGDVWDTANSLRNSANAVNAILTAEPGQTVTWIDLAERDADEPELALKKAPLNVGPVLNHLLWSQRESRHAIVLTGATLTVRKRWNFLRDRLTLPTAAREKLYGSPFDYQRHSRIFIASDLPHPPRPALPDEYEAKYEAALAEAITRLAGAADGRTMVLFTSYSTMNNVAGLARADLEDCGLQLKVQRSDGSPAAVADALRREPQTVVFGVDSLWTGVDIPGENLSLLIICRLPFKRPNDPIHAARAEQYRPRDFYAFTLPLALLRLRQGFGRLIRSRSDRGVCVILNSRLNSVSYRGYVRQSLPRKLVSASVPKIAAEIEEFLTPTPADSPARATTGNNHRQASSP